MTRIPGKDLPLEDSIEKMSGLLEGHGFDLEQVSWLNPIPNVWSVKIRDRKCPMLCSSGKGMSKEGALASALGEFIERISSNYYFADFYLGKEQSSGSFVHYPNERWFKVEGDEIPQGLLDEAALSHYNMDDELKAHMLIDMNSGNRERGICALPFVHQRTDRQVWFPVNIIGNLYANNGMSAGNNKYEARVQALSEIFECHIKSTIISSGIGLPRIPQEVIDRYPLLAGAIEALRKHGFVLYVLDASLGGKFPLVNVTLFNPKTGGCLASFGAHPKFEVALERAITSLLQGRELDQLEVCDGPVFDLQLVADQNNLEVHFSDSSGLVSWDMFSNDSDYDFAEWNIEGDSKAEFEHLCHLIHRVDMDIYISDYEHLGAYACRIIVPGMSEIYPVEKLVRNNNNVLIDQRPVVFNLVSASDEQLMGLLGALDGVLSDEDVCVSELLGVAPDSNSYLSGMHLTELRCLIRLKLGDLDGAAQDNEWLVSFGDHCTLLHRCLYQLLKLSRQTEIKFEEIEGVLSDVFGQSLLARCQSMLRGGRVFEDLPAMDSELMCFKEHSSLLAIYKKMHILKAAH